MGGGQKSTTSTRVEQTPEEKEYTRVQIDLAKQQLRLVEQQSGWQSEIYEITKPLLAKYGLMVDQQFDEWNTPEAADLRARYRTLENAQLDATMRMMPIQEELLQMQLDEIRRGGRATEEQKRLIGEITDRAIETGDIDINRFLNQGLGQIREELAPARGLRPTDSPMLDAGGRVLEEAIRQKGQLTSQMRGAQANAELNFPLNASQVFSAQNQWQQNFGAQMGQFMAQQRGQADQNRNQLMAQLFTSPMSAGEQGLSLINASRPSPVSFPRNTTETTKTSGGSILGGIGGLLQGVAQVGGLFSSEKLKEDIKPIKAPEGHVLSPGELKWDKRRIGRGYNDISTGVGSRGGWGNTPSGRGETSMPGAWQTAGSHPIVGNWAVTMTGGPNSEREREATVGTRDWVGNHPTYGVNDPDYRPLFNPNNQPLAPISPPPDPGTTIDFDTMGGGSSGGSSGKGGDLLVKDPPWWNGKKDQSDLVKDPPMWGEGKGDPNDGPQYFGSTPTNTMAGPQYRVQPGLGFANPPQSDEDALQRIANLPVSQWRYKPETGLSTQQHVGPMAEDFNTQVMGRGPEPTIPIVDNLGALTLAVKALEKRTRGGNNIGRSRSSSNLTPEQIRTLMRRRRAA